jgi:hypothetical protein
MKTQAVLEGRYRSAVDVKRAANLYAQGRTLRQMCEERAGQRLTISGSSYADLLRACSS